MLIPLWNCWYFFALYANAAGYDRAAVGPTRRDPLDRYLLAKTRQYVADMTRQLDDYEIANACDSTRAFLDVLSNWYIRRSRERFWAADGARRRGGLRHALHRPRDGRAVRGAAAAADHRGDLARADRRAVGAPDRLARPPTRCPADDALVTAMDQVREVCSAGSALRKGAGLRNRLPLADADRRGRRRRRAGRVRADRRRRAQRQVRPPARRRSTPTRRRTASRSG